MVNCSGSFVQAPAEVFVGRETFQGLEPLGEVVGADEVGEVAAQLVVGGVVEALDCGLLDGAVHPLDLAVGPGMLGLSQAMIDIVAGAGHVEGVSPERLLRSIMALTPRRSGCRCPSERCEPCKGLP